MQGYARGRTILEARDLLNSCWLRVSNVCREGSIDFSEHGQRRITGAGKEKEDGDRGTRRARQIGSQRLAGM